MSFQMVPNFMKKLWTLQYHKPKGKAGIDERLKNHSI